MTSSRASMAARFPAVGTVAGRSRARALVIGGAVLAAAALSWALGHFGATQTWEMERLFLLTLLAAGVVAVALPWRELARPRLLPFLAFGLFLLLQIVCLPTLRAEGYVLATLGWLGVFLGLVLARLGRGPAQGWVVFLLAVGAVEAFYGLAQALGGGDAIATDDRGMGFIATGSYVNRNHFAGLLNLTLALALGMIWYRLARHSGRRSASERRAWSWLVVLASSFIGLAVLLSQSRGGTISLVLTLTFVAVLLVLGRRGPAATGILPWILLTTILGLGLAIGLDALLARFSQLAERQGRVQVYADTLEMIGDRPLLGVGPGMYRWAFRPYQSEQTHLLYDHAHNDYLQAAAEWGIPLALLLWGFVGWRFYRASRAFLLGESPWERGLALGCAAAMLSILLHSLVDFNLQIPATLLIFGSILGLAWGLELRRDTVFASGHEIASDERNRQVRAGRVSNLAVKGLIVTLVILVAGTAFPLQRAAALAHRGPTFDDLQKALSWNPDDPVVHFHLGLAHRDLVAYRDLERARHHLARAAALNPRAWKYHWQLGVLYELTGREAEADAAYLAAVELNPRHAGYRWRLGNFRLRHNDLPGAAAEFGRALEADPALGPATLSLLFKAGADWRLVDRTWPRDFESRRRLLLWAHNENLVAAAADPDPFFATLWNQLLAAEQPLALREGSVYVRRLADGADPLRARTAWVELTRRNGVGDAAYARGTNLVWNGDFELPVTGVGLGWIVGESPGYAAEQVAREGTDGTRALRLAFDGSENPAFHHVYQRIPLPAPGSYRVRAAVRGRDLTTDRGLRVEIVGRNGVLWASEEVTGTTPWREIHAELVIPAGSPPIVTVRLRRQQSLRIDNLLSGAFWLDDVELIPSGSRKTVRATDG